MITNDELDIEVLAAIGLGKVCFHDVLVSVRHNAKQDLPTDLYRPIDRALQRVRKRGAARFVKGGVGWQLTSPVSSEAKCD